MRKPDRDLKYPFERDVYTTRYTRTVQKLSDL